MALLPQIVKQYPKKPSSRPQAFPESHESGAAGGANAAVLMPKKFTNS